MELLPKDVQFLQEKGFNYTVNQYGAELYLTLTAWRFPSYAPNVAEVLIIVSPGYPMAPMDMFWTRPSLRLSGGGMPT
jgi:hypothetical protein